MYIPLYIDPGTGSMLLSLFIGLATAATFGIRAFIIKLQFIFSGGKIDKKTEHNSIPYVIFSDHKRYWNVFKFICDEFEKRQIDVVYYTCSFDDPILNAGYKHIKGEYLGEGNKPFAILNVLHADILIATTPSLDVYQWKRSKAVKHYVHIPHTVDDLSGYKMFGLDYYDSVLTTGQNQNTFIRRIESLRPKIKQKELVTVGSLTQDYLKKRYDENVQKINNEKKVVLVAPSWGKSGILAKYGEKFLDALSNTDFEIIIRPHPQTYLSEIEMINSLQEKYSNFEWNRDNDNFDVLNKADILITDFSGIIFDYSLVFNKPLIYADTDFDKSPYDADWIDDPVWSLNAVKKLGIQLKEKDFVNIENVINEALNSTTLEQNRNDIRKECWENIDHSAEKAVEWLIQKHSELTH